MTLHVHALRGCRPTPLAHYLKALAVLRLVSEQADRDARGFWRNDVFHLATSLDEEALLRFFAEHYAPTPILSPWNGGSGFYKKDNKNAALMAIVGSEAPRLAAYREALRVATAQVAGREESPEKGSEKSGFIAECFNAWPEAALAWPSAAIARTGDDPEYPALLGTGGNDGNFDFANNFMQRVADVLDLKSGAPYAASTNWLRASLLGEVHMDLVADKAIGQFFPGAAGGANGTAGFDSKSLINPWDFVFMLEGAIVVRVGALRRLDGADLPQAAAAFAVRASTLGHGSAAAGDDAGRGEQWLPIWDRPSTRAEVDLLFAEGRMSSAGSAAQSPLDAARAIARLGVARGVSSFTRVGYLVRNGLSNLAVPLGTYRVEGNPQVRLLDEIDDWMARLRRAAGGKTAPASFERVARTVDARALTACQAGATRQDWCSLVEALGEAEHELGVRGKATAEARLQPLPPLSAGWVDAMFDGTPEMRLALAIATQRDPATGAKSLGPLRAHCIPLDEDWNYRRFASGSEGLRKDPRVVWTGRDLVSDLTAVALRRAIDGRARGRKGYPLAGSAHAPLADVRAFLEGNLDEPRIARLVRGLTTVSVDGAIVRMRAERSDALPLHALVRLTHLPHEFGRLAPHYDATALRQLASGRLEEAAKTLQARLVAMGLRSKLRVVAGDARFAQRLAACVTIPVAPLDLEELLRALTKPFDSSLTVVQPESP